MIHDDRFTIGQSLIYDVLELKHPLGIHWNAERGECNRTNRTNRTYRTKFHLDAMKGGDVLVLPGVMQPYRLDV